MATGSKGKGSSDSKGAKDGATGAARRSRRKTLPSLSSNDVSDLDESAEERVAPSSAKLTAAAESAKATETPPSPAVTLPTQKNEDRPIMTTTTPEAKTEPPAAPAATVAVDSDLANKVAAAKSLAGSAIGVAAIAGVLALAALIAGPAGNDRQLLRQDVAQLKQESRALTLALAVEQTRMAIQRSAAPFEPAVAAIGSVAAGDAEAQHLVDVLRPLARTGVPTMRQLGGEFSSLAGPALLASALPGEPSWVSQAFARVAGWTASIGSQLPFETFPPATQAALDRANRALMQEDLKAALEAIKNVEPSGRAMLQPWLASAARRAAAEDALARLSDLSSKRLSAPRT